MRTRIPALALAATLGLSTLLTACGSDDKDTDAKDTEKSSQTSENAGQDDAADDAETPAEEASEEAPAGDGEGGKPDRDDVIDGYTDIVKQGGKDAGVDIPDAQITTAVTCLVDAIYDDASAKTLNALADGEAAGIDPADVELFTGAQTTCQ